MFFLYLYLPIGPGALAPVEWALAGGWVVLGVILAILTKMTYKDVTPAETEYLIFGKAKPQSVARHHFLKTEELKNKKGNRIIKNSKRIYLSEGII